MTLSALNLTAATRKSLALVAALLLVTAVAFFAVLIPLIRNAPDSAPVVVAFADGKSVQVTPFEYCDVRDINSCEVQNPDDCAAGLFEDCPNPGIVAELPVKKGRPLQLSLPSEIWGSPWVLAAYYGNQGDVDERLYLPDEKLAVTVEPINPDGLPLTGVEIRLPTGIIDAQAQEERIIAHAIWSIRTS